MDQWRAGRNTQPMPALGEAIRSDEIGGARGLGPGVRSGPLWAQQAACPQHEGDASGKHGQAERGPTEEAERREAAREAFSMIMFGEEAISVIIPLISAATDRGMSRRLRFSL